jgi:1-acyl-sn-glycerol-3-phosphate acyltransferase
VADVLRILFFLLVVKPFLALIIGVNLFGPKNLPHQTACIVVANHNSHLDALILMNLFPLSRLKRVHPVAAADYFLTNPALAWFSTTCLNILPIPRKGIHRDNNPITKMGERLAEGDSLILFPEGSRGDPEQMKPFQAGIAHLILKHPDVPVVPVFIHGAGKSLPKGELVPVPFFCDVVIGQPTQYRGTKEEIVRQVEADVVALAQWLEAEVQELETQENEPFADSQG